MAQQLLKSPNTYLMTLTMTSMGLMATKDRGALIMQNSSHRPEPWIPWNIATVRNVSLYNANRLHREALIMQNSSHRLEPWIPWNSAAVKNVSLYKANRLLPNFNDALDRLKCAKMKTHRQKT